MARIKAMSTKRGIGYRSMNRLGDYLKKKRTEAGMSQIDISKLLGYTSGQFISNWERGVSSPPMSALIQIANALKVDQRELIDIIITETKETLMSQFKTTKKKRVASS